MIAPSSLAASSQFLGLRIATAPNRPSGPFSPPSPTLRSPPTVFAVYTAAAERSSPSSPRAEAATQFPAAAASTASLYDVLGIPTRATAQEIKTAYRRLARECHPDVAATAGGQRRGSSDSDNAADEFMRIHEAYAVLSDPDKRADYDRKLLLLGRHRRPFRVNGGFSRSPTFPSYGRRTWETDQCW